MDVYKLHNNAKLNYEKSENARIANSIIGLTLHEPNKPAVSLLVVSNNFKPAKGATVNFFCKIGDVAVPRVEYSFSDLKNNDFANTFLEIVKNNTNESIAKKEAYWN